MRGVVTVTVIGTAWIDIKGDTDGFEKETESKIGNFAKKAAAVFAGAFVLDKGVDFLKDSIGAASDLNETINKSNTIFGANAKEIDKWSQSAATSLGLSRQKALDAAASFGDMFRQIGFTGDQATKMSKQVVQMSADIGSFNNLPTEDVQQRIAAAFRGEYDSLQAVIPNINAARVEQEAMAETGKKTTKELTAQEKAAAVLAIVHKDGARAMGDFEKTSSGLANSQKILSARMEDVKARIGTALLPVMTTLVTLLSNGLTPALDYLAKLWDKVKLGLNARGGACKEGDVVSDGFVGQMERLGIKLRELWEKIGKPFVDFMEDHWKPILIAVGIAFGLLVAPVATVAAGLIYLYAKFDIVRDIVDAVGRGISGFVRGAGKELGDLVEYLQRNWEDFSEAFGHIMVVIRDIVTPILLAIRAVWNAVSDDIFNYVERVWNMIVGIVKAVMEQIRAIIQIVTALINGDWGKVWDGIKDLFKGIWDEMYAILAGVLGMFSSVVGAFFSVFSTVWENGWDGIVNFLASIWDRIYGLFEAGFNWITDHWKLLLGVLLTIVTGGLDLVVAFIVTHLDDIVDFFKKLPGRILDALGDVGGWLVDTGGKIVKGLLDGLVEGVKAVYDFWFHLPANILAFLINADVWLADTGLKIVKGLLDGLVSGAEKVWDFYTSLPGRILAVVGDLSRLLWGAGGAVLSGMKDGMENGLSLAVTFFRELPGRLLSFAGDLSRLLWGAGGALLSGFKDGAEAALGLTFHFFMELPGRVLSWVGDLGHLLWGAGGALLHGLADGITAVWYEIGMFWRALPGLILQAVGDLGHVLWGAGAAIMQGMARGIRDFGGELIDAILDALGPLAGIAKKVFHIGSPSKVFMEIGQNLMLGLAEGIRDVRPVRAALNGLDEMMGVSPLGAPSFAGLGGISASTRIVQPRFDITVVAGDIVTAHQAADIAAAKVADAMEQVNRTAEQIGLT